MKIHILGICGTFMGGVAALAKAAGHDVSGCDAGVYPPMSEQLSALGIDLIEGWNPADLPDDVDMIVVGNVVTRGNPLMEAVLDRGLPYTSGPQWLAEHVLHNRWVLAVAGTHGKTTTSSILAWLLEAAGLQPGFLIGGVPGNFDHSARLGQSDFFVVEADEYDTAFFDKRSKFVHYRPRTVILNNLEYDHADIFPDLAAIQRQFHHLVRTVPSNGRIIANAAEAALADTLAQGCWTPVESFAEGQHTQPDHWRTELLAEDGSAFRVYLNDDNLGEVHWPLLGQHNVNNALAAIAAARHVGVPVAHSIAALADFAGVKRRLEVRAEINGTKVYDDFAHHPTAITATLKALRANVGQKRILALLEPRSNTMRLGVHKTALADSLNGADKIYLYQPADINWQLDDVIAALGNRAQVFTDQTSLQQAVLNDWQLDDQIVIMSNGGFGGIHNQLIQRLQQQA